MHDFLKMIGLVSLTVVSATCDAVTYEKGQHKKATILLNKEYRKKGSVKYVQLLICQGQGLNDGKRWRNTYISDRKCKVNVHYYYYSAQQ